MEISCEIYNIIINSRTEKPPETGGILGEKNGVIIETYLDSGIQTANMCSYIPNVDMLNKIIKEWQEKGIMFSGVFHTHFWGVKTLSKTDKEYIYAIMKNMPKEIKGLYFPLVVMPEKEMICYRAELINEKLAIEIESIKVKDGGK